MTGQALAQVVIDGGNVVTVPSTHATPWLIGDTLTVGQTGNGTLTINPGSVVTNTDATLGEQLGSVGVVTINGGMTGWSSIGGLAIGSAGEGHLTVSGGSGVWADLVSIGDKTSGVGVVTVDGGSLLQSNGALAVGNVGTGTLTVKNGGAVEDQDGYVGYGASRGPNLVTITGAGSKWTNTSNLVVAQSGDGALEILAGGKVTVGGTTAISYDAGTVGQIKVDGSGSTLEAASTFYVGYGGRGDLDVSNGGNVSAFEIIVAAQPNSIGSITVSGPGATLSTDANLTIGLGGEATLRIANGGTINTGGDGIIGNGANLTSYAFVTGTGSTWNIAGNLSVGTVFGSGGRNATISDGGVINVGGGTGTVSLGGPSGSAGTLTIGGEIAVPAYNPPAAAGTLNAAAIEVGDHGFGQLNFNHTNTGYVFAPVIYGVGSIAHYAGETILTADSSAFSGTTVLAGGTLSVNGKLGGTMDVRSTGRLQGIGTVGETIVSGTIAPGNSIGTLNVAGNITFNPGSIYEVEVNAAGQGDKTIASGNATINGGTVKVLAGLGNYAPQTQYTILTANGAGGRAGTFSGVTSNLAFLDPLLSYDANNVYLTMTRNVVSFQNVGITPNQIATGGGVESLGWGDPVYNAVLNLSADQAQYAFDQLSGEIHASARIALIEDSRFIRNAVNDRIRAAFDGVGASGTVTAYVDGNPVTVKANTDRLAVWGQGFGSWGHTNSDGNATRLNRSTGGFFVGADAPVFDTWRFGAVAGYSRTNFDVKDRRSSSSSDNYYVGLYGGTTWGDLAFRTGAAYTWHDVTTNRSVIFPGFGNRLTGDYNAATAQVFGELAYGFNAGGARFEPFANLAYVNLHTDSFTERGRVAALTSPSSNIDATFATLGLRGSTTFNLDGSTLTARGMLGWRHAFGDVTPLSTMRFAGGGNAFSIGGVPIARDAAVIEAGLDYAITPNATLGVTYGGQFGSGMSDQSVKANFNVKF